MTRLLRQSTAKTHRMGPFLDDDDGVTPMTGLTIAQADIQISKDGGAFAQTSEASPTTTHDADGWYQIPLTANDTDTLGPLTVQLSVSGALPVWEHGVVVPANVYDALVAGTDSLNVDFVNTPNTTAIAAIQSGLATPANILGANVPGVYTAGQAGYLIGTNLDTTVSSRSTLAAGAQMDLVNAPNATAVAAIVTAVWAATTRSLTTFGALAADTTTAVWAATTRTLTSFGTLVADTTDAVWDELLSGHTTAGSAAAKLVATAGAGDVVNSSPISLDGTELYLTIGYDYTSGSDSQPCTWTDSDSAWPSLSGATVSVVVKDTSAGTTLFSVTGTVSGAGTSSQAVSANITAANTSLMEAVNRRYAFYLQATWASDRTTRLLAWGWVFPRSAPPLTAWG